jgi:hypothetical protein
MVPFSQTNELNDLGFNPDDTRGQDLDVRLFYKDTTDIIAPSVLQVVFGGDWQSRAGIKCNFDPSRRDFHPTPNEFVEYLEIVAPGRLSAATKNWMQTCDQQATDQMLEWREPNRPRRL